MEIRNFKDLEKAINQKIKKAMENEVAKKAKEVISDSVEDIVYGAGTPSMYLRRGLENGSLGDEDMIKTTYIDKDGVLQVTNEADFNHRYASNHFGYGAVDMSKSLAENIEYGYGSKRAWWNEPRPFMENAKDRLSDGEFKDSLIEGLKREGLKIE